MLSVLFVDFHAWKILSSKGPDVHTAPSTNPTNSKFLIFLHGGNDRYWQVFYLLISLIENKEKSLSTKAQMVSLIFNKHCQVFYLFISMLENKNKSLSIKAQMVALIFNKHCQVFYLLISILENEIKSSS